jgi:hypothetical protein
MSDTGTTDREGELEQQITKLLVAPGMDFDANLRVLQAVIGFHLALTCEACRKQLAAQIQTNIEAHAAELIRQAGGPPVCRFH